MIRTERLSAIGECGTDELMCHHSDSNSEYYVLNKRELEMIR